MKKLITVTLVLLSLEGVGQITYASYTNKGASVPVINSSLYKLNGTEVVFMTYPGAGIPLSTGSAWGTSITNNSANWNTAYSWVNTNGANAVTAYGWGNHASANYIADSDFSSQGIMLRGASTGVYSILTDNSLFWNRAVDYQFLGIGSTPGKYSAIKRTGRVVVGNGIDTTYQFQVGGDVNITGNYRVNGALFTGSQWTTSGSDIYYNTGNVSTTGSFVSNNIKMNTTNKSVHLGIDAGKVENTSSSHSNVMIGYEAGKAGVSTNNNVLIGYQSGLNLITAGGSDSDENVFVGFGTGLSSTTAQNNVFVGIVSGYSNTTARYNTFLGSGTGYYNTTGWHNTYLGYFAGRYGKQDSTLIIDGLSRGDSATQITNAMMYGRFNQTASSQKLRINANVGINTPASIYTLDVNGSINGTSLYMSGVQKNTVWDAKIGGSGTSGTIPIFNGTSTQTNSTITSDGTTITAGTISAGNNLVVTSTEGSELAPALTTGNWTLGAGWQYLTSPDRIDKNIDGTGTVTPTAATFVVAGAKYTITIVVSAISGSTATWTLGDVSGVPLTSATTYTENIIASTTGKLIITPVATSLRVTISSISVKLIAQGTGDLTVKGNVYANNIRGINSTADNIIFGKNGNVGIKTSPGAYSLDINGAIRGASFRTTSNYGNIILDGQGTVIMSNQFVANGGLALASSSSTTGIGFFTDGTSGTERMRIQATTGNVGIAITSPVSALHIDKGNATASSVQLTAGTTTQQDIGSGTHLTINTNGTAELNQKENLSLYLKTNNTTAVTIDNAQNVTVAGDFINSAPHGSFYRNSDLTISASQNVWYKITGFTTKTSDKMTVTGDSIQLTKAGYYAINITTSFSGLNNEIWEIGIFKNGILEDPSQLRYTSTSDVGNMSCPAEISSDGNDWVSFKIRNTTDNDDPTIKRFSAIISTIHL